MSIQPPCNGTGGMPGRDSQPVLAQGINLLPVRMVPTKASWRKRPEARLTGRRRGWGGEGWERENTGIWDKTLTVGESPTKGRGQHLIAQFLYLFYTFKNFQNKNWEGWTFKQNLWNTHVRSSFQSGSGNFGVCVCPHQSTGHIFNKVETMWNAGYFFLLLRRSEGCL